VGAREFSAQDEVIAAQRSSGLPTPDRFERYDNADITRY
jgi:hypothetical protein